MPCSSKPIKYLNRKTLVPAEEQHSVSVTLPRQFHFEIYEYVSFTGFWRGKKTAIRRMTTDSHLEPKLVYPKRSDKHHIKPRNAVEKGRALLNDAFGVHTVLLVANSCETR